MFHKLLRDLHEAFPGDIVYIPAPLYSLIHKWLVAQGKIKGGGKLVRFQGKELRPYDEDAVQRAYQLTPIHVPQRIMEKAHIIEFSLPEDTTDEQAQEQERPEPEKTDEVIKPVPLRWRAVL